MEGSRLEPGLARHPVERQMSNVAHVAARDVQHVAFAEWPEHPAALAGGSRLAISSRTTVRSRRDR